MYEYEFEGSVYRFDTCICQHWTAVTYAPSVKKALSNLKYRFKKENGYSRSAKIHLEGNLHRVEN